MLQYMQYGDGRRCRPWHREREGSGNHYFRYLCMRKIHMKKFYYLILLILPLLAGGCSAYKEISVSDIRLHEFTADSAGRVLLGIGFTVNNPTSKRFTLLKADIAAFIKETPLAKGSLEAPVEIPAHGNYGLTGNYAIEIDNPLLLLSAGAGLKNGNGKSGLNNITLDINATIKQGGLKKNFKYRKIPLSGLLN